MSSLPTPPLIPQPGGQWQTAPAPFQGYNAPPTGTQLYPPSGAANLVQGINAFVQQFQSQRDREKEKNANLAQQSIQNLLLGLPVDLKKTATYMKKAGMNLDFDSTAPPPPPPASSQPLGAPVPGAPPPSFSGGPLSGQPMPGGPPPPPGGMGGGPSQPPPSTPPPPQSRWQQILQTITGANPNINPDSPGMRALQRLAAQGQQNSRIGQRRLDLSERQLGLEERKVDLDSGGLELDAQKQAIFKAALSGNPSAIDMANRVGLMKESSLDGLFNLARRSGVPEEKVASVALDMQLGQTLTLEQTMGMAQKWAERFDGDMTKAMKYITDIKTKGASDLQPSNFTLDDRMKLLDKEVEIQKLHPTMPSNLAKLYARAAVTTGMEDYTTQISELVDKFPTTGQIDYDQWSDERRRDLMKFSQSVENFNRQFELDTMKAVMTSSHEAFEEANQLLNNKNSSELDRNAATNILVDALRKRNDLSINLGGKSINLGPGDVSAEEVRGWVNILSGGNLGTPRLGLNVTNPKEAMKMLMEPPAHLPEGMKEVWRDQFDQYIGDGLGIYRSKTPGGVDVKVIKPAAPTTDPRKRGTLGR